MSKLDERTQEIYQYIVRFRKQTGNSPTLREIGTGCHIAHTTVLTHLARLEGMDWIVREMGKARSIMLGRSSPDYEGGPDV